MESDARQCTTTIPERPTEILFQTLYSIVPTACLFTSLSWSSKKQGHCDNADLPPSQSCQQSQYAMGMSNEFAPHSDQFNEPPLLSDHQSNEPPADHQCSELVANHQSSEPPANHQSTESPADHQSAEAPANHQSTEPPAGHQSSEPHTDHQSTEPPADHQSSEPFANYQSTKLPANHQSTESSAGYQSSEPPAGHQSNEPPTDHQSTKPPADHQCNKSPFLFDDHPNQSDEPSTYSPLTSLFKEQYRQLSEADLKAAAERLFFGLSISDEQCKQIEKATCLQSKSDEWTR